MAYRISTNCRLCIFELLFNIRNNGLTVHTFESSKNKFWVNRVSSNNLSGDPHQSANTTTVKNNVKLFNIAHFKKRYCTQILFRTYRNYLPIKISHFKLSVNVRKSNKIFFFHSHISAIHDIILESRTEKRIKSVIFILDCLSQSCIVPFDIFHGHDQRISFWLDEITCRLKYKCMGYLI